MELVKTYKSEIRAIRLFEAWVSEDMVIEPAVKIESSPTVGGHYKLHAANPPDVFVMVGEFKEVEWGKRLVYTWNWQGTDEITLVTVEFSEGGGQTTVNLKHEGFDSQESLQNHDKGWDSYFRALETKILDQV